MKLLRILLGIAAPLSAAEKVIPPHFPRVQGKYRMTDDWSVTLPREYARRLEEKSLVLWRKGITCWTDVWVWKKGDTRQKMLEWVRRQVSERAVEKWEFIESEPKRIGYLLHEKEHGESRWALYCFALGDKSHVMMSIYFDDRADLKEAQEIWKSLEPVKG